MGLVGRVDGEVGTPPACAGVGLTGRLTNGVLLSTGETSPGDCPLSRSGFSKTADLDQFEDCGTFSIAVRKKKVR